MRNNLQQTVADVDHLANRDAQRIDTAADQRANDNIASGIYVLPLLLQLVALQLHLVNLVVEFGSLDMDLAFQRGDLQRILFVLAGQAQQVVLLLVIQRHLVGELILIDQPLGLIVPVVLHVFLHDANPFLGAFEDIGGTGECGGVLRLLLFQHDKRGLLAAFQSVDDLRNACQLAIDIPALIVADHTATGTLADVDLVNGGTSGNHLPFGDELLDHYPLDGGINVGGARISADLTGHVDPPGIGTGDREGEKGDEEKQAEPCRAPNGNTG